MTPLHELLHTGVILNIQLSQPNDGREYSYSERLLGVDDQKLLIPWPAGCPFLSALQHGWPVHIECGTSVGYVAFDTKLTGFLFRPTKGMTVSLPDEYTNVQRRQHVRIPWVFPVELRLPDNSLQGSSVDISGGGLKLQCPLSVDSQALQPDDELMVRFKFRVTPSCGTYRQR